MNFFAKCAAATFLSFSLTAIALGQEANAQSPTAMAASAAKTDNPDATSQGWHVDVAPYLWFAGIDGTVSALGHESSVHVTAGDVLSNFNFGLMGMMEARYNRIVIPIDFMWAKLTDNKGIPITDNVESVHVKINEDIFTPKIGYRLVDNARFRVDWVIGIRYWHVGNTFTLQPTQIANGFYGAANWVDGIQGARFQGFLTPKLLLTIAGDAGGGGARLDYQVVGLVGYKVKKVTLQGGWRYLAIHKGPSERTFINLAMTGVILGVVIPLK
jgi:hypothetical protein